MRSFIFFADQLSTSVGKAFSWCIVILMGGTCYEVFMAKAFNAPTLWNFDFSLQMYGAIFMMAGAYTLSTEAHVRGDVIYRLFKPRTQGYIDLVLYFIFFYLIMRYKKSLQFFKGSIFCVYLITGGFSRFIVEFLRTNERYMFNLSSAQYVSLFMIVSGLLLLYLSGSITSVVPSNIG